MLSSVCVRDWDTCCLSTLSPELLPSDDGARSLSVGSTPLASAPFCSEACRCLPELLGPWPAGSFTYSSPSTLVSLSFILFLIWFFWISIHSLSRGLLDCLTGFSAGWVVSSCRNPSYKPSN